MSSLAYSGTKVIDTRVETMTFDIRSSVEGGLCDGMAPKNGGQIGIILHKQVMHLAQNAAPVVVAYQLWAHKF